MIKVSKKLQLSLHTAQALQKLR